MKIQILSDLHNEFGVLPVQETDAEVIVLAGDIDVGTRGIEWAHANWPDKPIVYVMGNHEFYRRRLPNLIAEARQLAKELGHVYLLDDDQVTIDGVRFVGATLWTDFRLFGETDKAIDAAMDAAKREINDFRKILYGDVGSDVTFAPRHAAALHARSVSWLAAELARPHDGPTVVVTHHCPHRKSLGERWAHDTASAAFVSDLDHLVRKPVDVWIHGHTHDSYAYEVNGTRVYCNPRGYAGHELNPDFDPRLVVEVPDGARPTPRGSTP